MSKALALTLLIVLIVLVLFAVWYLSRPKHLSRRNVGSAAEHYSPQDPGSKFGSGGGT